MYRHQAFSSDSVGRSSEFSGASSEASKRYLTKQNRHSIQSPPVQYQGPYQFQSPHSRSVFDLNGSGRESIASAKRSVHLLPNTPTNGYEIPVPAKLLRPPTLTNYGSRESINKHQSLPVPQRYNHQKTQSVPVIDPRFDSRQNFVVDRAEVNANALLDFQDLKDFSDSQSVDEDYGKKKRRFWFFGKKKAKPKSKPKSKKSIAKSDTKSLKPVSSPSKSFASEQRPAISPAVSRALPEVPMTQKESKITAFKVEDTLSKSSNSNADFGNVFELGSRASPVAGKQNYGYSDNSQWRDEIQGGFKVSENFSRSQTNERTSVLSRYNDKVIATSYNENATVNSFNERATPNSYNEPSTDHKSAQELPEKSHNNPYSIKNKNKIIVFGAESESLDMKMSPESKRTVSSVSELSNMGTVIRKSIKMTPPPLPPKMETIFNSVDRDFKDNRSMSDTSSENDPRVLYSPINDTFSLTSHRNSSLESISTLETKEVTFGGYNAFTAKTEQAHIKEKEDRGNFSNANDTSVYSELDSEFAINHNYSLASSGAEADVDKTFILEALEEESIIIGQTIVGKEELRQESDDEEDEEDEEAIRFSDENEAADYANLIKAYTSEYISENNSEFGASDIGSETNVKLHAESNGDKSLKLIHYYELNSSRSTFKHEEDSQPQTLRVVNNNKRDFSFASSIASDVQFDRNIASVNINEVQEVKDVASQIREFSESSVLYYSDSDMVHNPVFSDNGWDSYTSRSGTKTSSASTLLSAVNSLYGDYIHKKGFKDVEDMCNKTSQTLAEVVKQIKIEQAESFSGGFVNGVRSKLANNSVSSTLSYVSQVTMKDHQFASMFKGVRGGR